ncbi:MAG: hypothetical protein ABJL67_00925 [Sulfitobacter sp.]
MSEKNRPNQWSRIEGYRPYLGFRKEVLLNPPLLILNRQTKDHARVRQEAICIHVVGYSDATHAGGGHPSLGE